MSWVSSQGVEAAVFEDGVDFARVAEFEHGLDRAGVLAGADERFVGAFAEHEFERADDDGLAGAGFPGDADQAGAEFPDEFIDEGEIADFEKGEHSFECRALCKGCGGNQWRAEFFADFPSVRGRFAEISGRIGWFLPVNAAGGVMDPDLLAAGSGCASASMVCSLCPWPVFH